MWASHMVAFSNVGHDRQVVAESLQGWHDLSFGKLAQTAAVEHGFKRFERRGKAEATVRPAAAPRATSQRQFHIDRICVGCQSIDRH